jgi:hypothetical protein
LAELVGVLRSDQDFRRSFDERLDGLLAEAGVCRRGPDGYLGGTPEDATPGAQVGLLTAVLDGLRASDLIDNAVDVLRAHGRDAWRNCVGDVATVPVEPTLVLS